MADLNFTTPLVGRWLADAGPEFADIEFDITDTSSFPSCIPTKNLNYSADIFWQFHSASHKDCNHGILPSEAVHDDYFIQLIRLSKILRIVRDRFAINNRLSDSFLAPKDSSIGYSTDYLSLGLRIKSQFRLMVARQIVFNALSVREAASKFKVNLENVLIWLSVFLNYGPLPFLCVLRDLSPEKEKEIALDHFSNNVPLHYTAAKYGILNRNRLKRLLHRHRSAYGAPSLNGPDPPM